VAGHRTRYAIVGLGSRARLYTRALIGLYRAHGELVGMCDSNALRIGWHNRSLEHDFGAAPIPAYAPPDFARMLREQKVETVIVTSVDSTHHRYIVDAMRAGCDVITEKPMTIEAARCQEIVDAVKETGRRVTVAFNYRYAPRNGRLKHLLDEGTIGTVLSGHFEWLLDTNHGADYFRRWHRDKASSGGLMVHKASHHFDLLNWWLGARPETVFGFGRLAFYGRENAERRGVTSSYARAHGAAAARTDPFALHLDADPILKGLYLDAEQRDGYWRDRNVFSDGISIEDDVALVIRYSTGAAVSYHLTAYSPWEGYRVALNGTEGRLELEAVERSFARSPAAGTAGRPPASLVRIAIRPHWREPIELDLSADEDDGSHSGADAALLAELFAGGAEGDPLGRGSSHVDGALAILPGIGANRSFETGRPVGLTGLVTF
jgi:predicted dehydrogenase